MISALLRIKQDVIHSIVIFSAILIAFISSKTDFDLQFIALFIVLYIISDFILKKSTDLFYLKKFIDIFFLTSVVFLVIFSTGSLFSPLFFLIYFLLFGVSLLFEPSTGVYLSLFASIFLLLTPRKEALFEFLQLASLFLIAPLSTIFGSQYKKLISDEEKIKVLSREGQNAQDSLVKKEEKVKSWTDKELRNRLSGIWKDLDSLVQESSLDESYSVRYRKLKSEIIDLLKSAQILEKKLSE